MSDNNQFVIAIWIALIAILINIVLIKNSVNKLVAFQGQNVEVTV